MMKAPLVWSIVGDHLRLLAQAVNQLIDGGSNAYGTVTLTANAAATTLTDAKITPNTVICLMPTTSNAAAAIATTYISARAGGTATITHANNAQADKTFAYSLQA